MKLIPKQRILPNGTKDEIRVSGGKAELIKRVSDDKALPTSGWEYRGKTNDNNYHIISRDLGFSDILNNQNTGVADYFTFSNKTFATYTAYSLGGIKSTYNLKAIIKHYTNSRFYLVIPTTEYTQAETNAGADDYVQANLIGEALTYQLARPKIYQSKFIY
jgi:hypothetical protein